jgi:hypothetical protein
VVSFTHLPLYPPGKNLQYPLYRRLVRPQSQPEQYGGEKYLALARKEPNFLSLPGCSLVATLSELSLGNNNNRLNYLCGEIKSRMSFGNACCTFYLIYIYL